MTEPMPAVEKTGARPGHVPVVVEEDRLAASPRRSPRPLLPVPSTTPTYVARTPLARTSSSLPSSRFR